MLSRLNNPTSLSLSVHNPGAEVPSQVTLLLGDLVGAHGQLPINQYSQVLPSRASYSTSHAAVVQVTNFLSLSVLQFMLHITSTG